MSKRTVINLFDEEATSLLFDVKGMKARERAKGRAEGVFIGAFITVLGFVLYIYLLSMGVVL